MAAAAWLAATKLTAPARRRDVLRRDRLVSSLQDSFANSRLTLVSAPAGAGKTTLLSELPHAFPDVHFCWLLLDPDDNDPSRFTAALIASLQSAGMLNENEGPAPNEPRQLVTFLINRIAQTAQDTFVFVIDDLHLISERAIHDLLDYLLDHAPANLRVVLATRYDPPMSLAKRRARGEVTEIRLDDLSFTAHETGQLTTDCLGLQLSPDEVQQLHNRTEGWAAGLRLLATTLTQTPANRAAVFQSGIQGSRRIFDFLAEEVLDQQSDDLRRFLLETSILSRLRPDVCDRFTGRRDAAHLLEDLYRRNLYVVAADESESSFRYHDLFADFLRERLRRLRPEDWKALHAKAAAAEDNPQSRMRHLLAAESWDKAAEEIQRIGSEYIARGFVVTLKRWIEDIPESIREQYPRLLYLHGQAIWTLSEFAQAQPYIERALAAFRRTNDYAGQSEALAALSNSAVMLNELEKCRELLKEAFTYDVSPAARAQLHTAAAWEAIYRKDIDEAKQHIDRVYDLVASGEARMNPLSMALVLFCEGINGYLNKIDDLCRAIAPALDRPRDFNQSVFYLLHSAVLLHRGDIKRSEEEAYKAKAIAEEFGQVILVLAAIGTTFAVGASARGDWKAMDEWAKDGSDDTKHGQIARQWRLHFLQFQARARWHSGDVEGLRAIYEQSVVPSPFDAPPAEPYRWAIRGMMHFAERAYAQAEHCFRQAMVEEDGFQVTRAVASGRVYLAYTLMTRGRIDEAMEAFSVFLDDSVADNIPGRLMHYNPIVQPLLRAAHERNMHRSFVEKVMDAMGAPLNVVEAAGGEALSDREMEVLRVMAEGLGNREIGERLFVSEATVKTHVQRIFRKLDSASRTQAVARARELMLI